MYATVSYLCVLDATAKYDLAHNGGDVSMTYGVLSHSRQASAEASAGPGVYSVLGGYNAPDVEWQHGDSVGVYAYSDVSLSYYSTDGLEGQSIKSRAPPPEPPATYDSPRDFGFDFDEEYV